MGARGGSLSPGRDASCLACSPPAPAVMMLYDPELVSGPLCPRYITEQIHPYLPSNPSPSLRSGRYQTGAQTGAIEGGTWAPPWAASYFSILEDWLFL